MSRFATAIAFASVLVLCAHVTPAQVPAGSELPADVAALIARPVSPATLALLRPHASDQKVQERWRDAVTHESPAVRAAAARMVHVAGVRWIVPTLLRALQSETDEAAAIEQVMAVVAIGDAAAIELAARAASRLQGHVAAAFLSSLARARPVEAAVRATQVGASVDDVALGTALALAARGAGQEASVLADVAIARGLVAWSVFLRESRWLGLAVAPAWIERAAAGGDAFVDELAWALAIRAAAGDTGAVASIGALPAPGAARLTGVTLARRVADVRPARPVDLVAGLDADQASDVAWRIAEYGLSRWLDKRERASLERHLGRPFTVDRAKETSRALVSSGAAVERRAGAQAERVRAFGPFPPGFVADVLAVAACAPVDAPLGAIVMFRDDGRPSAIDLPAAGLTAECRVALQALAMASVLPPAEAAAGRVLLVTNLASPGATCAGTYLPGRARYSGRALFRRDAVSPAVRTREVQPVVPDVSKRQGIQGVIIGTLVVAPSGCVSAVEVDRQIPTLSVPAVANILQWEFRAAEAGGTKVPSALTWILNFMY